MENTKWISFYHGMELLPVADGFSRKNENGIHFLVIYFLLKHINKSLTEGDIRTFRDIVSNITSHSRSSGDQVKGIYDRGAGESLMPLDSVRKISHDNVTAVAAFSRLFKEFKLDFHEDIAKYSLKWCMRFDNAQIDKPRWFFKQFNTGWKTSIQPHPRDWFYWLVSGGYKIGWVFFPIFFIANIISCMSPKAETSGKLLMFVRLESGSRWSKLLKLNKKLCYWILRKKYGDKWIGEICKIYFHQTELNPIRILSKDLEL